MTREILELVSQKLAKNPNDDFKKVFDCAFKELQLELEPQISLRTAEEIKFQLNGFDKKIKSEIKLKEALDKLVQNIDVSGIYEDNRSFL